VSDETFMEGSDQIGIVAVSRGRWN